MEEELEFDNQRSDEKIILLRRRHPWVLTKTGLLILLIAIIVVISFFIWGASLISVSFLIVGAIFASYLFSARWFVYANDIYILTNQRIINIDQGGFFTRRVSEAELDNIQNVTYEIKGPIKSFLNFGEIQIQTAGNSPGLLLKNIENPHFVQEKIVAIQKQQKNKAERSDQSIVLR